MLFQLELYESQFNDIAIRNTDYPVTAIQTSIQGAVPGVVEVVVVVVEEVVKGENIT